jgi:6-phosphogluconolactonase
LVNFRNLPAAAAALLLASAASGAEYLVYVGAYTTGSSHGIYGYRLETRSGRLKPLGLMVQTSNPSFLVEHPDHRFLYAVNEDASNSVSAFLIDPKSGKLSLVNRASSKGDGPCHLALDRGGRWLAVANYGSGSVAVLPLRKDGGVGEAQAVVQHRGSSANPQRQAGPHAHCVLFSPDNRFLLVADLGLDRIFVYRFDAETGALTPADPAFAAVAPGSGPRHLAFHPNGRVVYAINELASTVTAFRYDAASGALSQFQTVSSLPSSYTGPDAAAEIAVNAAGTMVYASDRGFDGMALLAVDPLRFTLSPLEFTPLIGHTPRHFAIDPTGGFLVTANQDSAGITVYSVHPRSGQLRPVGRATPHIDQPACVVFVPAQ